MDIFEGCDPKFVDSWRKRLGDDRTKVIKSLTDRGVRGKDLKKTMDTLVYGDNEDEHTGQVGESD